MKPFMQIMKIQEAKLIMVSHDKDNSNEKVY